VTGSLLRCDSGTQKNFLGILLKAHIFH